MAFFIAVPIRVDGLYSSGETVMQALADFRFLPYRDDQPADADFRGQARPDKPCNVNPEVAYLSENFVAEPFSDVNLWLPQGLHLHWALPNALTIGRHPPGAGGEPNPSRPIEFPAIPNRWLVIRTGGGLADKRWVVQSDYLSGPRPSWPADPHQSIMPPVAYPLRNPKDGEPPFQFSGRVASWLVGRTTKSWAQTFYINTTRRSPQWATANPTFTPSTPIAIACFREPLMPRSQPRRCAVISNTRSAVGTAIARGTPRPSSAIPCGSCSTTSIRTHRLDLRRARGLRPSHPELPGDASAHSP